MASSHIIDRFRKPEYTGDSRCVPCTVVNGFLAVVLTLAVSIMLGGSIGWFVGAVTGTIVAVISAASIYFRGYLIPGTPWLTKTYFPEWLLAQFEKHPQSQGTTESAAGFDIGSVLLRAGAVAPCEHEDDLCLTDEFRESWTSRIENLRSDDTSRTELATLLDVDPDHLTIENHGRAFVAWLDAVRVGQWESRAALRADLAAATALREWFDEWSALDTQQRQQVLYGLRMFLDECPACAGTVSLGEETVESCCRSIDIVAVSCQECNVRLFEVEHPGDGAHAT